MGGLFVAAESQATVKKEKLENVAIAMHCNLRPPDAAPVLIRFNCVARAKSRVHWLPTIFRWKPLPTAKLHAKLVTCDEFTV